MNDVKSEWDKAEEMQEAAGIAKHGIEGWRLLTTNWETTVNVLRRQLEWQRISLGEYADQLQRAKARQRKANRDNRELKDRLLFQQRQLRRLRWQVGNPRKIKPLTRRPGSVLRRTKPRKSARTGR